MRSLALAALILALIAGRAAAVPLLSSQSGSGGDGTVTIDAYNDDIAAMITFNDGAGGSGSFTSLLTQFAATYTDPAGDDYSFLTFCIDLLHEVSDGQTYMVDAIDDLNSFTNGAAMAYIYETYGEDDLGNDPIAAAAVQLDLWALSLNDQTPTSFTLDPDGSYSTGNSVFSVNFCGNASSAQIISQANAMLQAAASQNAAGTWLDASPSGNAATRGQSLIVPNDYENDAGSGTPEPPPTATGCKIPVPEPPSAGLLVAAFLLLGACGGGRVFRRA